MLTWRIKSPRPCEDAFIGARPQNSESAALLGEIPAFGEDAFIEDINRRIRILRPRGEIPALGEDTFTVRVACGTDSVGLPEGPNPHERRCIPLGQHRVVRPKRSMVPLLAPFPSPPVSGAADFGSAPVRLSLTDLDTEAESRSSGPQRPSESLAAKAKLNR